MTDLSELRSEIAALKTDVYWLRILVLGLLGLSLSGFHVFDPTLIHGWP